MLYRVIEDIYDLCYKVKKNNYFYYFKFWGFFRFLKRLLDIKKFDDLMWKFWSLSLFIDMVNVYFIILIGYW